MTIRVIPTTETMHEILELALANLECGLDWVRGYDDPNKEAWPFEADLNYGLQVVRCKDGDAFIRNLSDMTVEAQKKRDYFLWI